MGASRERSAVPLIRKLIAGDLQRRTRFHDEKGNLIDAGEWKYFPIAAHRFLARSLFGRLYVEPWWTFSIKKRIESILSGDMFVVEFGSGQSSLWLAQRARRVVSIEDNPAWAEQVRKQAATLGLSNLTVELRSGPAYWNVAWLDDASVDFCVVDGYARDLCTEAIMPKMKPGGWVFLDNSDWSYPVEPDGSSAQPTDVPIPRSAEAVLLRHVPADRIEYSTGFTVGMISAHQGMLCHVPE